MHPRGSLFVFLTNEWAATCSVVTARLLYYSFWCSAACQDQNLMKVIVFFFIIIIIIYFLFFLEGVCGALEMAMLVSLYFSPDLHISTTIKRLAIQFCTDTHVPHIMYFTRLDFGDPLTFPIAPMTTLVIRNDNIHTADSHREQLGLLAQRHCDMLPEPRIKFMQN